MNFFAGLALFTAEVTLLAASCLSFYRRGYERGRKDTEAFVARFNSDVEQERREIGKEEG